MFTLKTSFIKLQKFHKLLPKFFLLQQFVFLQEAYSFSFHSKGLMALCINWRHQRGLVSTVQTTICEVCMIYEKCRELV